MSTRVMVIGAHNDECEYGVGGVTKLLTDRGCEVRFLNPCASFHISPGEITPAEEARWKQQEQDAAAVLGASKVLFDNYMESVYTPGHDSILAIEREILSFQPQIVFIHWPEDNHIEHRMTAHDAFDALCLAHVDGAHIKEIYAFEAGPNQTGVYFAPMFAVDITETMPTLKESILKFDQPHAKGAGIFKEKEIAAAYRGHVAGCAYAEVFRIVKFPNGGDDFLLRQMLKDKFRWWGNGMYPAGGKPYFR